MNETFHALYNSVRYYTPPNILCRDKGKSKPCILLYQNGNMPHLLQVFRYLPHFTPLEQNGGFGEEILPLVIIGITVDAH